MRVKIFWAGLGAVTIAAIGYTQFHMRAGPATSADSPVEMATPAGITFQIFGQPVRRPDGGVVFPSTRNLADANGMTLYVFDNDKDAGRSACGDDCARTWPPAVASADAQPFGVWSLVIRSGGVKQWAYHGQPLYSSTKDEAIGDTKANGTDGVWHVAMLDATPGHAVPYGIEIKEVPDADGQVLVDDRGMTLYVYSGRMGREAPVCSNRPCDEKWHAVSAAQLANPAGDWTLVARGDGIRQWAYRGKPLYSFRGDLQPGDAYGIGAEPDMRVATIAQYFRPSEVTVQRTVGKGMILATARGTPLYRRDAYRLEAGGHGLKQTALGMPSVGRDIGTQGCDAACQKTWHPLKAAADARSSGFWTVATRDDGAKQWAYKGYALYYFDGDKKPGDLNGNDIYEVAVHDGIHTVADAPTKEAGAGGLYWAYASP